MKIKGQIHINVSTPFLKPHYKYMRTCNAESQKKSTKGSNLMKTTVLWPS